MKKTLIFSSLLLSSLFLSACGSMPALKQINKDAFESLPDIELSIAEMISGGASFSCVKQIGQGEIKFSYFNGLARIEGFGFYDYGSAEDINATSTGVFDSEKVYIWSNNKGYAINAEDFMKNRGGSSEDNTKNVVTIMAETFERIESPKQCRDELFDKDYFVPKAGLDFQVATSSVL